jgi:hypothetical protein
MKMKIKILETYYDASRDLVQWLVSDLDNKKKLTLCFPSSDINVMTGINAKLSEKDICLFNKMIIGKEINWESSADVSDLSVKDLSDSKAENEGHLNQKANKMHEVFDKYPFAEVLSTLEEAGIFKDASKPTKEEKRYPSILDFIDEKKK